MKKRKILASILIIVMCCGLLVVLAACPPLHGYEGVSVSGVILNDESELELTSVDYRFFISDYPNRHDFVTTDSCVTATYAIQNNSSDDLVAPLYLTVDSPFYGYVDEFDSTAIYKLYSFATDATHNVDLRCFYNEGRYYDGSDNASRVKKCLNKLYDDKQTDVYYNSKLPIYAYTFELSNLSSADGVSILLYESNLQDSTSLFFDKTCTYRSNVSSDNYDYYIDIDGGNTVTFYSIDVELTDIEQNVKFCDGAENIIENGGNIAAVSSQVLTFDDLAMTYYDVSVLSATDWYNAVLSAVNDGFSRMRGLKFFDISDRLGYMYQCDLTVPAHSDVNLTVQMPLYPTIDYNNYSDDVYQYELDVTNLSYWQGAPNVSVLIITEGFYIDSSFTLQQIKNGFENENLDKTVGKFTFTLSTNPNVISVKEANRKKERKVYIVIIALIALCYAVPITTVAIVIGCDNAKRKKTNAAKTDDTATKL